MAGRSTEGSTWPSHFKHNGSLNLTQTHWVTCHSVSHSPQRQLVETGRSGLGLAKAINCFLFVHIWILEESFPRSWLILVNILSSGIKCKNLKWEWNVENKKLVYDWFTAMWKQNTFQNLRKKSIAASAMSILIRILSVRKLNS